MAILKLTNITKIAVQFSPYRPGAASARFGEAAAAGGAGLQNAHAWARGAGGAVLVRAFLASVMCDKVKATNPKCEIVTVVKTDDSEPLVDIVYGTLPTKQQQQETPPQRRI